MNDRLCFVKGVFIYISTLLLICWLGLFLFFFGWFFFFDWRRWCAFRRDCSIRFRLYIIIVSICCNQDRSMDICSIQCNTTILDKRYDIRAWMTVCIIVSVTITSY